ncbi:MAG: hypothetical protein WC030_00170 [Candidatus Paceibacterota bacterium]
MTDITNGTADGVEEEPRGDALHKNETSDDGQTAETADLKDETEDDEEEKEEPLDPDDVEGEGLIKILLPHIGLQEPNLPVQWCVAPKLIAALKRRWLADDAHVLFCITDENGWEVPGMRQIVPLMQVQTWIPFRKPGAFTIHARVVSGDYDRSLMKYLVRDNGSASARYDTDILHADRIPRIMDEQGVDEAEARRRLSIHKGTVSGFGLSKKEIMIDEKLFAPPPSPWLAWWIMFPNSDEFRPDDECHFRKQVLWAIPKIAYIGPWALSIVLWRALLAFGWRILLLGSLQAWKPLLHPFAMRTASMFLPEKEALPTIARGWLLRLQEKEGDEGQHYDELDVGWWTPIGILQMPLTWLVLLVLGTIPGLFMEYGFTFWNLLIAGLGTVVAIASIIAAGVGLFMGKEKLEERYPNAGYHFSKWLRSYFGREKDEFADIVCEDGKAAFKPFSAVPKNRQLIFNAIKHEVCKIYARS